MRNSERFIVRRRDPLALEIQRALTQDLASGARLVQPRYRPRALKSDSYDGYCAVATAAYFFLTPKSVRKNVQPMQYTHPNGSHWWIVKDGRYVVDLTLRPKDEPDYDSYENGRPRAFMQTGYKRPSKRASELMRRVRVARRAS